MAIQKVCVVVEISAAKIYSQHGFLACFETNMSDGNKRAKLVMKTPNPLYLSWLEEWLLEAMEQNQPKRMRELKLATESLKKYPVRLNSAKECIILQDFSRKLVDEIELREQLAAFNEVQYLDDPPLDVADPTYPEMPSPVVSSKPNVPSPPKKFNAASPAKSLKPKTNPAQRTMVSSSRAPKPKASSPAKGPKHKAASPAKAPVRKSSPAKAWHGGPSSCPNEAYPSCSIPASLNKQDAPVPCFALDEETHNKQMTLVQDLIAPSKTTQKSRAKAAPRYDMHEAMDAQETPAAPEETIIFAPGSFQIILLIDTGEKGFLSSVSEFSEPDVHYEVRHLKVGDYAWVARGPSQKELLLPFLVERKRLDDLSKSIKDGRFSEQKFRLKVSNIPNIIYLIENHNVRGNMQSTIQGISNMLIKDQFTVKETRDNMDSMQYLANLTRYLSLTVAGKTLVSSPEYDPESGIENELVRLPEFGFFFAGMGKLRTFTTKEMFTKQLVQLHGLSADKAWAIVSKYQTPRALIEAFRRSDSSLLSDLTCGLLNRKLGHNLSSILYQFYTSSDFN